MGSCAVVSPDSSSASKMLITAWLRARLLAAKNFTSMDAPPIVSPASFASGSSPLRNGEPRSTIEPRGPRRLAQGPNTMTAATHHSAGIVEAAHGVAEAAT